MGRCTDRRDMTKAVESGVKLQTNKQTNQLGKTFSNVINKYTFIQIFSLVYVHVFKVSCYRIDVCGERGNNLN